MSYLQALRLISFSTSLVDIHLFFVIRECILILFLLKENPKESIVEYLEQLRKARLANLNPPSLFEDQNLQSIFGMLDPGNRGFISYKQYSEGN